MSADDGAAGHGATLTAATEDEASARECHVVQFYEDDAALLDRIARFVGMALAVGDPAVVLASEARRAALAERLRARGLDIDRIAAQGRYLALDAADMLARIMPNGKLDADQFAALLGDAIDRAAAAADQGRPAVFGEWVALLAKRGDHGAAVEVERLWNDLARTRAFALLCAYPMGVFAQAADGGPFDAICAAHTRVVPVEVVSSHGDDADRLRVIAELQQRAKALATEVAERQRVEAALRAARDEAERRQRLYETVTASTPDLIYIFDRDYRFIYANEALLQMWGRTWDEAIGQRLSALGYEPWHAEMHEREIDRVVATKQPIRGEVDFPHAVLGRRTYDYIFAPVLGPDGEVEAIAGTTRDITERKQAEAHLREEREALATINRVGRLLAAELDLDALVQGLTDAATALTGAAFGAFFYNTIDERGEYYTLYTIAGVSKEAFSRFPLPRNTALFGPTFRGEGVIRLDDVRADDRHGNNPPFDGMPPGRLAVVSYLAVPVVSRAGEVVGGLFFGHPEPGVFDERAERLAVGLAAQAAVAIENAQLYRQAQSAIKLRDEFLSSVSHDLKTPLSAIKGQAQLLRRRLERGIAADDDRLQTGLDSIDAAATRMTSLIDELLDVAKLQAEQPLEMQREAVDLTALTRQMVEEVRRASGREAIEVRTEAPGLVGVWDSRQLGRVLENLLGNAVKYSPNGEPVDVAIAREERDGGAWAVLTVRDHGIGIPEADVPHVFERFHRGGNVGGIGGSGIGLAAARRIVVQHGGTIAVESREGEGSAFTVRLPLAPPMAG